MMAVLKFLGWRSFAGLFVGLMLAYPVGLWRGDAHGYKRGVAHEQRAEQKRLDAARKAVLKRQAKADKITDKAASQLTEAKARIEYRTRTIIERIPVYVSQASDDRCVLPVGVVLLHNQAAAPGSEATLSEPASGSEKPDPKLQNPEVLDAPSGVALSQYAETVTFNYGVALQWREEALSWRRWWTAQAEAWRR